MTKINEDNRTGLADMELRLVLDRLRQDDPPALQPWYVDLHGGLMSDLNTRPGEYPDTPWRLCDGATNDWIGTISDDTGEEVLDLSALAAESFERTWVFACRLVAVHNMLVLSIMEQRS